VKGRLEFERTAEAEAECVTGAALARAATKTTRKNNDFLMESSGCGLYILSFSAARFLCAKTAKCGRFVRSASAASASRLCHGRPMRIVASQCVRTLAFSGVMSFFSCDTFGVKALFIIIDAEKSFHNSSLLYKNALLGVTAHRSESIMMIQMQIF
jgi:hypothetical protein